MNVFPSAALAQSEIWDEPVRKALKTPRYKKKDIDERKSKVCSALNANFRYLTFTKNLVPGTPLSALRQDDRIPALLIQRSLEPAASVTPSSNHTPSIHGYCLILPAGWSMPFFSSLTHTGTRVGGLRERQTQSFESGVAYFPREYPFTKAAGQEDEERAQEEQGRWERKPPAKRCNWEKVGTRSPWKPDWEVVLGLEVGSGEFVTTQRDDTSQKKIHPWLLRGPDISQILSSASKLLNPSLGLHAEINKLRLKRDQRPLESTISADDLWRGALVRVQLKMCNRGNPGDLAVIYAVGDEEAMKWRVVLEKHNGSSDEENPDQVEVR
jgi:ribonuclease P/MRP protein subunit POP1